jgi:alginate O-acetyltransferase complex protein AlgI
MAGAGAVHDAAGLIGGIIYQPYYVGTVVLAALITWTAPQTWDWSRRLSAPKAVVAAALFVVAAIALTTQAYNPFIYSSSDGHT